MEIGKYVKLTKHLTLSFSVRQPHRWLTAAVFLKVVTDRNVCWCLLLTCTVCWCLLLNCTHLRHGSALLYCTVGVCYCECGSASVPVTAVSWMLSVSTQALHAALYRSIYSVLTWSCLGTLQGFLGTFEKFLTVSSYLPLRPSVCMEQLRSHCMDFHEFWYLSNLRNVSTVFKFH